jgi:hypothetical protein
MGLEKQLSGEKLYSKIYDVTYIQYIHTVHTYRQDSTYIQNKDK